MTTTMMVRMKTTNYWTRKTKVKENAENP